MVPRAPSRRTTAAAVSSQLVSIPRTIIALLPDSLPIWGSAPAGARRPGVSAEPIARPKVSSRAGVATRAGFATPDGGCITHEKRTYKDARPIGDPGAHLSYR